MVPANRGVAADDGREEDRLYSRGGLEAEEGRGAGAVEARWMTWCGWRWWWWWEAEGRLEDLDDDDPGRLETDPQVSASAGIEACMPGLDSGCRSCMEALTGSSFAPPVLGLDRRIGVTGLDMPTLHSVSC